MIRRDDDGDTNKPNQARAKKKQSQNRGYQGVNKGRSVLVFATNNTPPAEYLVTPYFGPLPRWW